VPIALIDLIYRMLEKDPQARIPSVRVIGAELEAILEGRDITPSPARFVPETPVLPCAPNTTCRRKPRPSSGANMSLKNWYAC
jgi:hypothetical protein